MDGSTGNHLTGTTSSVIITSVERETNQLRQFPLVGSELAATGTYHFINIWEYPQYSQMETRTCKECGAKHHLDLSNFPSAGKINGVQYYRHKSW